MRSARRDELDAATVAHWLAMVGQAAGLFEARWTRSALVRVDAGLAKRLFMQIQDFDKATVTGSVEDVEVQGAATVRGWTHCRQVMEGADVPDDAYVMGFDDVTGLRVAIGVQRAAAGRVAELHGKTVLWVSADEVAGILGQHQAFMATAAVRRLWPGATVETYPNDPAKEDAA